MFTVRHTPATRQKGFTLIELLTVIAIIAILAGIIFTALPRVRERAKLTRLTSVFNGIRTALVTYAAKPGNGGYPPAYGFLNNAARGKSANVVSQDPALYYYTKPYGVFIELAKAQDIYDNFAESADWDKDGVLSPLEYAPIGIEDPATNKVTYTNQLYTGPGSVPMEEAEQLKATETPVRYVPVNLTQFARAKKFWVENAKDPLARTWDPSAPELANMTFPPPKYDAYVLISVGPGFDSFGVLADPPQGAPAAYAYHIAALRTYFLATRDLDNDGALDFDFDSANTQRTSTYTVTLKNGQTYQADNLLPSATAPAGYGPKIFTSN